MTVSYAYDPNGNLVQKSTGASVVRYYWDAEDKMMRSEDSVVMNFKTDALGFRRFKEVVGQGQTWFVYDLAVSETPGLAPLVAEYDANGNLVAKYHHDGGGLLAMVRGNQSYWYAYEAIGTTRQLMNAQGQVTDSYALDAWGNLLAVTGTTANPFVYVGKENYYNDEQNRLMLLGLRYYDPLRGRFVTVDPLLSQMVILNLSDVTLIRSLIGKLRHWEFLLQYTYSSNRPTVTIDPTGLWGWTITPISGTGCVGPIPIFNLAICGSVSLEWRCCCGPRGRTCRWFLQVCFGVGLPPTPGVSIGAGGGGIINCTNVNQTSGPGGCLSGGVPIWGPFGLCGQICLSPGWVVSIEVYLCVILPPTPGGALLGCWSF